MNARMGALLLGASAVWAGCSSQGDLSFDSAPLETNDQKASYGIGLNVGTQIIDTEARLDRAAFMRGLEDALRNDEPAVPRSELESVLQAFAGEIEAAAVAEREAAGATNAAEGSSYQAENAAKEEVTTTESGLQYEVLRAGDGPRPEADDLVRLHYRGTLIDGTEFDASYGGDPAEFGVGGVIPGFSEALQLMPVGSHYRVVIPSELGYGPRGSGPLIGPNATLIFEIELLGIVGGA
jgi:FKBP-type peptidyl-prolyl cis-trans isomerase